MKILFKRKYKFKTLLLFGFLMFLFGLSFVVVSYANNYNSSEISYDTSTSGAVQTNVKDALDFLYNKTKSGASAECPENMSCVEKPGVVMNVTGPGTVDKGTVYVGLNESNTFIVTPKSGMALHSISCDNGYTLSNFSTVTTAVQPSLQAQTITITNPGTTNGATCQIKFGSNEISVSSTNLNPYNKGDTCNSNESGCICYQIKNNITNFTYGSHTGCNFKSTSCYHADDLSPCDCAYLYRADYAWADSNSHGHIVSACSGVVTCET